MPAAGARVTPRLGSRGPPLGLSVPAARGGELRRDRPQDGTAKEKDVVHSGRKTGDGPTDHGNPDRPENARHHVP